MKMQQPESIAFRLFSLQLLKDFSEGFVEH